MENRDYVSKLTASLNNIENKFSTLSNDHQQYKIDSEHTICVLSSKLNASEEIVKQILPGNLLLIAKLLIFLNFTLHIYIKCKRLVNYVKKYLCFS